MRTPSLCFKTTAAALIMLIVAASGNGAEVGKSAPSVAQKTTEQQRQLTNKLKLLEAMVQRSPAAQRIDQSTHSSEAKALLAAARDAFTQARQSLERAELEAATRYLDEGLRAFGIAARSVADPAQEQESEHQRYDGLHDRIVSFRESFARVLAEKGAATASALNEKEVVARLQQAEILANQGRYREANTALAPALDTLEAALAKARDKETLIRTLDFKSPQEEYAYELERNRSHEMLIQLMNAEQSLPKSSRAPIEQLVARNRELRARAETLLSAGDTSAAIKALEEGTQQLVRALRLGGMPL
ncbi:MAG: hypothetical protein U1F68_16000 [Gammaproteobacteria bacterium]